jgi:hypothetical protein
VDIVGEVVLTVNHVRFQHRASLRFATAKEILMGIASEKIPPHDQKSPLTGAPAIPSVGGTDRIIIDLSPLPANIISSGPQTDVYICHSTNPADAYEFLKATAQISLAPT